MNARLWLGLLLVSFILPGWAAELRLNGNERLVALNEVALAFEDKEARLDIETVAHTAAFVARPELLRGSLAKSAIWLRFDIANDAPQALTRWLVVRPATLLDVQMFFSLEGTRRYMHAGSAIPFAQRPVTAAVPVFPVTLAPGQTTTLYLRVAGPKLNAIQPELWDPLEFRTQQGQVRLFDGLLLGGLLVMTLVGTLLLVLFRDRVFLFNALATGSYFLGEFNAKGYALMHLWPQSIDFTVRGLPLFAAVGVGLNLLFLRALLQTRDHTPRIDRLLVMLLAAEWVMLPGLLFGNLDFWKSLSLPQHFPITVVMVLVGVHAVLRGVHAARYYTVAYFLLA